MMKAFQAKQNVANYIQYTLDRILKNAEEIIANQSNFGNTWANVDFSKKSSSVAPCIIEKAIKIFLENGFEAEYSESDGCFIIKWGD